MDVFQACHAVNDLISDGNESAARDELIKLLAKVEQDGLEYSPLINRLIRNVGLFPYMEPATSSWEERYVFEVFKVDVGSDQPITLHREQSRLLHALLAGKSIAVSAPTSFGKSFVIDSFIAIKRPSNVVIIVPTIALADETRRRLQNKFGSNYKIITTPDQTLAERNILVFPQERAIGYLHALTRIDILIVDEFYKASRSFDKERSPALIRSIIRLGQIAAQRYFLAPNISALNTNVFTDGMEFLRLDFNTVFLDKTDLYSEIGKDEKKKSEALLRILSTNPGKTLIYAGSYPNIKKVSNLMMDAFEHKGQRLLYQFQSWLAANYDPNWELTRLVTKGVGIHNGQLHRSLSQIQIKLFEEEEGLDYIISTSSIIEGVNTSARNVILWSNKNGTAKINDFTYKNIIGRGGRMFRHFVGKIFVLEEPPPAEATQLTLELPDELLGTLDEDYPGIEYTPEQIAKIEAYEKEMQRLVGADNFEEFRQNESLQSSNVNVILTIAKDIRENRDSWNGLGYLNSEDPRDWDRLLYKLMKLQPGAWEVQWSRYVEFVKVLTGNWYKSIPELLEDLTVHDIGLDDFFKLERNTTYKLAALLSDVHTIYNSINKNDPIDLTPAIARFSHAFLPTIVFQLEEYGMPRMVSKKINAAGVIKLDGVNDDIHDVIEQFRLLGIDGILRSVGDLADFELYILQYFYEGIGTRRTNA